MSRYGFDGTEMRDGRSHLVMSTSLPTVAALLTEMFTTSSDPTDTSLLSIPAASEMLLVPLVFLVEIEERFLSEQADAFALRGSGQAGSERGEKASACSARNDSFYFGWPLPCFFPRM